MQQSETTGHDDQAVLDGSALQAEIAAAPPAERERILRDAVREQAASVLDFATFDDDSNFLEQGLTSLKALELTRNLMTLTGIEIPLVAIIEHPTPTLLAQYIAGALDEAGEDGSAGDGGPR
ncbi:acyl carrier protein [Streptomyces boncukensis]|uniref:Acyl carrier protein n=1 Tax=Streptomyces boncukensis TaxID=2711219 RepID=A0A6G4X7Z9_9ACTN|nr:acyl carrier protein [Streptomyces boncukensis]NGO72791.1 acyl carrier protein [Streptomyces boncukensis]